ncbi:HIRAN domain-containing protein [Arthrobacter citreus]|uniref:HIRAN domain-containing protein n=1 Tax=Arthrobacter TaxID=1663 RepID=UPI00126448C5|nr:HIRAN domain-containing protein [Arthrobacter gandavensis]
MGFWAKISQIKENVEAVKTAALPQATPDQVLSLNGDRGVFVVGGEYVPRDSQRVPTGAEFTVELRREPTNPHDKNAVAVLHKGRRIGYFSEYNAANYATLIDIANKGGQTVQAAATAHRERGEILTHVAMPNVYDLAMLLGPAASRIAEANNPPIQATIKQLAKYQEQLSRLVAGMEERRIQASVVLDETPSGKYKGQNMVKFFFQGEEIGVLPAQYRDTHQEFFRAAESGKTTCMVLIRRYDERLWAGATMY